MVIMQTIRKILILTLVGLLIAPQITLAAWWNPFTWKVFNRVKSPQAEVQKIVPVSEIEKLRNEIGELKKKSNTPSVALPKLPTSVDSKNKTTVKSTPAVKLSNSQIIAKIKPAVVYIETGSGAGSGMIFSADGYVLTNGHVVKGYSNIDISVPGGGTFSGTVTGRDEEADLAVVKIVSEQPFPKVDFGDSSRTEQGDEVFTFGFPFGIEGDVSFKEGTISRRIEKYLETSAEIHPGNSGGPLVNRYGQVIGINTAIFGKSVSGVQLGETIKLAIPINNAKNLIAELKAGRNIVFPTEPVQPQRQTYPIIPQEDISSLSPGLQAVATASYNEFRQIPDLQYLTPQQQYELLKRIADRRMADYEAQLRQRLEQLNRINQIISPQPAPPPTPKIPFDFDVQVSVESSGPTGGSRIVRFSIISEPFYVCTSLIKGRYDLAIDTKEIRSGNTIESGYLDNGAYKYEIGCIGSGGK